MTDTLLPLDVQLARAELAQCEEIVAQLVERLSFARVAVIRSRQRLKTILHHQPPTQGDST